MSKQPSIRDHLESEARRKYPRLAHRLSRGTPAPPHGWQTRHPRRALRWEARGLLILTSVLLLLLIVALCSVALTSVIARPFAPARAVRPVRCR